MRVVALVTVSLLGCVRPMLSSDGPDHPESCNFADECAPAGGHAGPAVNVAIGGVLVGTLALAIYHIVAR